MFFDYNDMKLKISNLKNSRGWRHAVANLTMICRWTFKMFMKCVYCENCRHEFHFFCNKHIYLSVPFPLNILRYSHKIFNSIQYMHKENIMSEQEASSDEK